jgi:signal transduction histidine kinase
LVREAVANAVRHAKAKRVTVSVEAKPAALKLVFINDGAAFPKQGGRVEMPLSLSERVEQAGGAMELSRGMNLTKLSISLPIRGSRR